MAKVTDRETGETLTEAAAIEDFLGRYGIWYRRFETVPLEDGATDAEILAAYRAPIEELEAVGGYTTADVIAVDPSTPDLDELMKKFQTEHTHAEDEVRLIVSGHGLFHIHPEGGPVFSIEVEAQDMINVPKGTRHWFHLCQDRTIRAIRLFQDSTGWVPEYTESGADARHEPLCFGAGPGAAPI